MLIPAMFLAALLSPQNHGEDPKVLLERARILYEEKGDATAAMRLLAGEVVCRPGLPAELRDRAIAMLVAYNSEQKASEGKEEAPTPLPLPQASELDRLIDAEIEAFLSGGKKTPSDILWYGKAAIPRLIRRLERDYFLPGVAKKCVPLILLGPDPEAARRFLAKVRTSGNPKLLEIVGKSFPSTGFTRRKNQPAAYLAELEHWVFDVPDEVMTETLPVLAYLLETEALLRLAERKGEKIEDIWILNALSRRKPRRLERPEPLFRLYRSLSAGGISTLHPGIFAWLLHQKGGLEVLGRSLAGHRNDRNRGFPISFSDLSRIFEEAPLPSPKEALKAMDPVLGNRRELQNLALICFKVLVQKWPFEDFREFLLTAPETVLQTWNLRPRFQKLTPKETLALGPRFRERAIRLFRDEKTSDPLYLYFNRLLELLKEVKDPSLRGKLSSALCEILAVPPSFLRDSAHSALLATSAQGFPKKDLLPWMRILNKWENQGSDFRAWKGQLVFLSLGEDPSLQKRLLSEAMENHGFLVSVSPEKGTLVSSVSGGRFDPDSPTLDFSVLFLKDRRRGSDLFPSPLNRADRIDLVRTALERMEPRRAMEALRKVFFERDLPPWTSVSSDTKEELASLLFENEGFLRKAAASASVYLGNLPWELLPWKRAERIAAKVLAFPGILASQVEAVLRRMFELAEDPLAYMTKVTSMGFRPGWTTIFRTSVLRDAATFYEALDRFTKADSSALFYASATEPLKKFFAMYPSPRGRPYLLEWLRSGNENQRKAARTILDDWKRAERERKDEERAKILKALWARTQRGNSVDLRITALKGLFDLGEDRAWTVLLDWMEGGDSALREKASALAARLGPRK